MALKVSDEVKKLKFEIPSIEYKEQAIDYINEFYQYNSEVNGVGELHRFLDNYEVWLQMLEEARIRIPNEETVPTKTFFLVRESDNRIVGMINIRLALNEKLKKFGGHIGYGIRPTERQKGYNKINLYLALLECQKHNIKEVLMDCDKDNIGSAKTIHALGGKLVKEYYDNETAHCIIQNYIIDVDGSLEKNALIYKPYITR